MEQREQGEPAVTVGGFNRRRLINSAAMAWHHRPEMLAEVERLNGLGLSYRADSVLVLAALSAWYASGLQSVQMPATYQAALMATDARAALDETEVLPWPAFEIQVPPGLLTAASPVFSVIIAENRGSIVQLAPGYPDPRFIVIYSEEAGCNTSNWYPSLQGMFNADYQHNPAVHAARGLTPFMEQFFMGADRERRVWTMVARLIAGVILAINQARADDAASFGGGRCGATRIKHGHAKATTWLLGKPLDIDVRHAVSDYVAGRTRGPLNTQHLRRGHWRNQPFGHALLQRRRQWIQPTWVGEGPRLLRPVRLGLGFSDDEVMNGGEHEH